MGLSIDEFEAYQTQLMELGQENFQLREELDRMQRVVADLPRLRQEVIDIEDRRRANRERHEQTLKTLRDEIEALTGQISVKQEEAARRKNEKTAEIMAQIMEIGRQTKDKDAEMENLKGILKVQEDQLREKQTRLEQLKKRAKTYEPFIRFLVWAKRLPMFLEDLDARVRREEGLRVVEEAELEAMDRELTALARENEQLDSQIRAKTAEAEAARARGAAERERADYLQRQLEETEKRLEELERSNQRAEEELKLKRIEADQKIAELEGERVALDEKLEAAEAERVELQSQFDRAEAESGAELAAYDERIAELRRRLARIRDTGEDEDIPHVDREIQGQIEHVRQERLELEEKEQMLKEAIRLVNAEIEEKKEEILEIVLKQKPTPKMRADPEFQRNEILLEELVLQNRELKESLDTLAKRAVTLREENEAMRARIRAKKG